MCSSCSEVARCITRAFVSHRVLRKSTNMQHYGDRTAASTRLGLQTLITGFAAPPDSRLSFWCLHSIIFMLCYSCFWSIFQIHQQLQLPTKRKICSSVISELCCRETSQQDNRKNPLTASPRRAKWSLNRDKGKLSGPAAPRHTARL